MLFLALDNTMQDVSDLIGDRANSDIVTDYKRLALKNPSNNSKKARRKCVSQPERPRILLYSRDISDRNIDEENFADWNVIACTKLSENTIVVLVTINGALTRMSIQMRVNNIVLPTEPVPSNVTTPSPIPTETYSFEGKEADAGALAVDQPELFCEIATMSENKCGLGVAAYNGKIFCVGGYGRTECLKSVESYCPVANKWTEEKNLKHARGRVNIALVGNMLYVVGGSNGVNELDTVECLSLEANEEEAVKWKKLEKLPFARSNAGVCTLNGKIYCVGGNATGQNSVKDCHVFDPEANTWTPIAPLNTGRCQVGVVAFEGKLWVAGGSDSWNCLTTVECYDPEEDKWTYLPSMLTARRGCGLATLNGRVYCIGGSDGSQSLKSTESYDKTTKTWILGPSLNTARANVGIAAVQNRLYAIGGFSGKKFLNTIEYFDEEANEWTKFAKLQPISTSTSTTTSCGSNGHVDEETMRDLNDSMMFELNRPSKRTSEKDKIREDESESNTIIMPL
jgi:influenza virus NS1A-binding protein